MHIYNIVADVSPTISYDGSSFTRRGLHISRSNVVINNVVHKYLTGPDEKAYAKSINYHYYGFFTAQNVANITIKNSRVHALNTNYNNSTGSATYDLVIEDVVNATIDNVVMYDYTGQANDFSTTSKNQFNDTSLWVVSASNRTKNVTWNNCILNRIDGVHAGKTNSKITNSKASMCITMIGKGDFVVDNVDVYNYTNNAYESNGFMCLRKEYGQTWEGTLNIKNSRLHPGNDRQAKLEFE